MIGVYRDPDGKDVFTNDIDGKSHNTLSPTVNSTSFTSDIISDVFMDDKQKIEALVQKIHELQGQSQVRLINTNFYQLSIYCTCMYRILRKKMQHRRLA